MTNLCAIGSYEPTLIDSYPLSSEKPYFFGRNIPDSLPEGVDLDLDEKIIDGGEVNDLQPYLPFLTTIYNDLNNNAKTSLSIYAGSGFDAINKQMRTGTIVPKSDMTEDITNIFGAMQKLFVGDVKLFRTEANNYEQDIEGTTKTSRELRVGDIWKFTSFISTSITNTPQTPKIQPAGKLTVFIFEFNNSKPIHGVYLGANAFQGEAEYLLYPGVAKVKQVYERATALGYVVENAKYVICELDQETAKLTKP